MNIVINGLIELQGKTDRYITQLSGSGLLSTMRQCTLIVAGAAKREAKVDTGRFRASITPSVQSGSNRVTGIVGSNVEYAPYVVLDTRPHWPPISAVRTWARRHGISAFLVARAISRRGTRGDYSLYKALEKNADHIISLLTSYVGRILT